MTESLDPFRHDDAAYVLGALPPDERDAFEQHLLTCADCRARVAEVDRMPALLSGLDAADFAEIVDVDLADLDLLPTEPVPDTLLPALLRLARREQQRRRWLVGSLAAVAAACVLALVVAVWPSSTSSPPRRDFVAVAQSPVLASATLTGRAWGTQIDVHCHYVNDQVYRAWRYDLVAYDRQGKRYRLGDWRLPPDSDIDYQAGTSLLPAQIAKLEITLPDGTPLLKLTT